MQLRRVKIQNFRSIKSATIDFEPRCRVLVGVNESGKSNILHALSFLDPSINVHSDDLRQINRDESPNEDAHIHFSFAFSPKELDLVRDHLRSDFLDSNGIDLPIFSNSGRQYTLNDFLNTLEGLYVVNLKSKTKYASYWAIANEWKVIPNWRKAVRSDKIPAPPAVAPLSATYMVSPTYSDELSEYVISPLTSKDIGSLLGLHLKETTEDGIPNVLFWEHSEKNLLPSEIDLETFAGNPSTCLPLKHMFLLSGFANIAESIATAKTRSNGVENLLEHVADRTSKHMQTVWKEMRGVRIELRESGSLIRCRIRDADNAYDFVRRSDGFKRFLTFLLMVSTPVSANGLDDTLYLHDEPEVGLHPSGARYLRDELIKISETGNNLVVYSTHSIFMIDRENMVRHLVVEKNREITEIHLPGKTGIQEEEVLHQALGASIFECLAPQNLLFEGWRDRRLFQVAKQSPLFKPSRFKGLAKMGTCFANGTSDIESVIAILELANRKAYVISDGDDAAIKAERRFRASQREVPWYRYDQLCPLPNTVKTEEDFLANDFIELTLTDALVELGHKSLDGVGCLGDTPCAKLDAIKVWCLSKGIKGAPLDAVMQSLKTKLFLRLTHQKIQPTYFEFLTNLENSLTT